MCVCVCVCSSFLNHFRFRHHLLSSETQNNNAKKNEKLRAFWYVSQCNQNIETRQQVGHVSISYQVGGYPASGYDFELTHKVSQLVKATPARFNAIYLCYDSSPWQSVADLISHLVSPILRVRLRSVQGMDYIKELFSFLLRLGFQQRSSEK